MQRTFIRTLLATLLICPFLLTQQIEDMPSPHDDIWRDEEHCYDPEPQSTATPQYWSHDKRELMAEKIRIAIKDHPIECAEIKAIIYDLIAVWAKTISQYIDLTPQEAARAKEYCIKLKTELSVSSETACSIFSEISPQTEELFPGKNNSRCNALRDAWKEIVLDQAFRHYVIEQLDKLIPAYIALLRDVHFKDPQLQEAIQAYRANLQFSNDHLDAVICCACTMFYALFEFGPFDNRLGRLLEVLVQKDIEHAAKHLLDDGAIDFLRDAIPNELNAWQQSLNHVILDQAIETFDRKSRADE